MGGGLDDLLVRFVDEVHGPMLRLLVIVCYVCGVWLIGSALWRLYLKSQKGMDGPSESAIAATFVWAGVLLSIGYTVGVWDETSFGPQAGRPQYAALAYTGLPDAAAEHYNRVLNAVFRFMEIIGRIGFVRGGWVLHAVGQGRHDQSAGKGFIFLIGGSVCANIPAVMAAVQTTLNVMVLNVR